MKKTIKKTLALSKTTIKQLTEVTGAAKSICTFGSTMEQPTMYKPTCISCPGASGCSNSIAPC